MATIGGGKLQEALDLLLEKMIAAGFIKADEKEKLSEKLFKTLEELAPDGNVPEEIFTNPLEQKKLMHLVVCASIEENLKASGQLALAATFNTGNLAKAFFAAEELRKLNLEPKPVISAFLQALPMRPQPGKTSKTVADEMTDQLLQQREELDTDVKVALTDALINYKLAMDLKEFNQAQAYGSSDGTPIVISTQLSNTQGSSDPIGLVALATAAGFFNEDVKNIAKEKLDESTMEYATEIKKIIPNAPVPEPR